MGISVAAFTDDAGYMATASFDGWIRIWDQDTGKEEKQLGPLPTITDMDIARQEHLLAVVNNTHMTSLDIPTNETLFKKPKAHESPILAVAFAPDGILLATGSKNRVVKIWDSSKEKLKYTLRGHAKSVNDVDFSADDDLLASASSDKTIRIWNVKTGKLRHVLKGHTNLVNRVDFGMMDCFLISASEDGKAFVWNAKTGVRLKTLKHKAPVTDAAFSSDGQHMVTATADGKIHIWYAGYYDPADTESEYGSKICEIGGFGRRRLRIHFHSDGTHFAVTSGEPFVRIWPIRLEEVVRSHSLKIRKLTQEEKSEWEVF